MADFDDSDTLPAVRRAAEFVVRQLFVSLYFTHGVTLDGVDSLIDRLVHKAQALGGFPERANREAQWALLRGWLATMLEEQPPIHALLPDNFSSGAAPPRPRSQPVDRSQLAIL